jgi:TolB protein
MKSFGSSTLSSNLNKLQNRRSTLGVHAVLQTLTLCIGLTIPSSAVHAELTIKITKGIAGALPIAVVPFGNEAGAPIDLSKIIVADLEASGRFSAMANDAMPARPHDFNEVKLDEWRQAAMENLVVGNLAGDQTGYKVSFRLIDVFKGTQLAGYEIPATATQLRIVSHQIADIIFEKLTGIRGAFATRIAYVTVTGSGNFKNYELQVADADGSNPASLLQSTLPIMSPCWSPDGRRLAYVSFEGRNSAIYVQDLDTGSRTEVAGGQGLNSAPAWSPDGTRLAMTRSRDGDPEIYVMDIGTRALQRITTDPAIDTEAAWSPDGRRLLFTSDRGGGPQIYEVSSSGGTPHRLTHEGKYNASGTYSPDGKLIAFLHGEGGAYRIAVQDPESGQMQILTETRMDESPSFAPNSHTIIYATVSGAGTSLAAVSIDGKVKQNLGLVRGEVRDPAWGPFRK